MNLKINHGLPGEKKFFNVSNPEITEIERVCQPLRYLLIFFTDEGRIIHFEECTNYYFFKYGKDIVVCDYRSM